MAGKPLYVIFTQDCEQLMDDSLHGGPEEWSISERSVTGLADTLEDYGLSATFFIVAQTAAAQPALYWDLEKRGFELGLHIHPQDTGLGYTDYLGGHTYDEQVEMFNTVADQWADAIGKRPTTFRGGNFSANDNTYPALVATGFTHGSVSSPGRQYDRAKAVWQGAVPYAHYAHKANRLFPGDLDFYEIPLTCDQVRRRAPHLPMELRIEGADGASHRKTVRQAWADMADYDDDLPKIIMPFTHNTHFYQETAGEKRQALDAIVDEIKKIADEEGYEVIGGTIGSVHAAVEGKRN
jgi:peptidoglycan/xylan/chitin deacetylase (PgdA/CDA1 family)